MTPDESCPKCGARLFCAIPGKTTETEILAFFKAAGREEATEQGDPWIHPGTYCPSGCEGVGALVEYDFHGLRDDRTYSLSLTSAGSDPARFIVRLRQVLGCSLTEARALASRPGAVLIAGELGRVHGFMDRFRDLDAKWGIAPPPPDHPTMAELLSAYYKPDRWPWLRRVMQK